MGKIHIGTSGWQYGDWSFDYAQDKLNYFYPPKLPKKKWLEYYSGHFKTVEVNATFYHQMKPATFENWAKITGSDFVFAIKASRFITHIKRLKAVADSLKLFLESVKPLDGKLGPVLWQMPPRFKADEKRLEAFLVHSSQFTVNGKKSKKSVSREQTTDNRLAFEFRDPSWFCEEIYQVLKKHNAALVIAESGGHWPIEEVITADFTYIRFHGEGGSYATKYTDNEIADWAGKIKKWQNLGIDVYAYFNNDVAAFAVENAETLTSLIS